MRSCLSAVLVAAIVPATSAQTIVDEALAATALTEQERSALRRFHGRWTPSDLVDPGDAARIATVSWDLTHPALDHADADELDVAQALARRGLRREAMTALRDVPGADAALLRGRMLLDLGETAQARASLEAAAGDASLEPLERLAALQARRILAYLDGQLALVDPEITRALGRWRDLEDPLFWPGQLLEARILVERDARDEVPAVLDELRMLNPRSGEALRMMGVFAAQSLEFEHVEQIVSALQDLGEGHVLASDVTARAALLAGHGHEALAAADGVLARWPHQPEALANRLASLALMGRDSDAEHLWATLQQDAPGWVEPAWRAGRTLARHRRFAQADLWLNRVLERYPGDPLAWTELGMMRWQAGDDEGARAALHRATSLDPWNRRAENSRRLLAETATYDELHTRHFTIRHAGGADALLAELMAEQVDAIHDDVVDRFGWSPPARTVIEILPDHERFAVRTIGLPDIHTIAACTGPVIAMEPPRHGPAALHQGPFQWAPVIAHEYAHVLNLGQTQGRVPLWLTEGAAVSAEPVPLDFDAMRMLSRRWYAGTLLSPDEHSWAFLRPREPEDRALAYAQAYWMLAWLEDSWGHEALPALLHAIAEGRSCDEAFIDVTGHTLDAFHRRFLDEYAPARVEAWGLGDEPPLEDLLSASTVETDPLDWLRQEYGERSDVLRHAIDARMRAEDWLTEDDIALVREYASVQPLDPLPDAVLGAWHLAHDRLDMAEPHLRRSADRGGVEVPDLMRLSLLYRSLGRPADAVAAMQRAVAMSPYDASLRERAAALAIESAHFDTARKHIEALIVIEPDEPLHTRRLEVFDQLPR